jgi:hypothetical protein
VSVWRDNFMRDLQRAEPLPALSHLTDGDETPHRIDDERADVTG